MEIVINPKFESYRPFLERIPVKGFEARRVFCNHRNLVALAQMGDRQVVVKQYKRPTWANCVIYTWFRKNKARRAYDNAFYLLCHGVRTPEPVAYMVVKRHGLVHTCYFVSAYLPWPTLREAYRQAPDEASRQQLEFRYVEFASKLHQMEILLRDNNASNTLVSPRGQFALVDINRLCTARRPGFVQVVLFYRQLGLAAKPMTRVASAYYHLTWRQLHRCLRIGRIISGFHACKHVVKTMLKRTLHGFTHSRLSNNGPTHGGPTPQPLPVREGSR